MLRVQMYPVMDGVEVWLAGSCAGLEAPHDLHTGTSRSTFISSEDVDKRGLEGALAHELTLLLHEGPGLTGRARCP